ncbi:YbaK/EbsC family protein [Fertoebacter nigrum]|uniref:YbaK/EbsC family protein n=1 Tax=Fertoeibacter niger TaxID=2656921 RepID=A0A8X8H286_9RHOB|nr:YbaK/EbsC family protein [Fertoeibacter niger]NUB45926.1 YbaK/EbsC family protein [Fertoeibacter niger]
MKSSVERVSEALIRSGLDLLPVKLENSTRTAHEAAAALGVMVDQIAKSIILEPVAGGQLFLFITAGSNRVNLQQAGALAGSALRQARPDVIRQRTGFAIGGVAPVGHLEPIPAWLDRRLLDFPAVWAAGGTPMHLFSIAPALLARIAGATIADFVDG